MAQVRAAVDCGGLERAGLRAEQREPSRASIDPSLSLSRAISDWHVDDDWEGGGERWRDEDTNKAFMRPRGQVVRDQVGNAGLNLPLNGVKNGGTLWR